MRYCTCDGKTCGNCGLTVKDYRIEIELPFGGWDQLDGIVKGKGRADQIIKNHPDLSLRKRLA